MHTLYIEIESLSEKLESRSTNSIFFFSFRHKEGSYGEKKRSTTSQNLR